MAVLDRKNHHGTNQAKMIKLKVNIKQKRSFFCPRRLLLKYFSLMAGSSHGGSGCFIPLISSDYQRVQLYFKPFPLAAAHLPSPLHLCGKMRANWCMWVAGPLHIDKPTYKHVNWLVAGSLQLEEAVAVFQSA